MESEVPKKQTRTFQRQIGVTLLMAFVAIALQAHYSQQQSLIAKLPKLNLVAVSEVTKASLNQSDRWRLQLMQKVKRLETLTADCLQRTQKLQ
jgi:hypothetical protein